MNNSYTLSNPEENKEAVNTSGMLSAALKFKPLLIREKYQLLFVALAIIVNAVLTLVGPYIVGYTIDEYIQTKQFDGVLRNAALLVGIYLIALVASYIQTRLMGGVGQRVLYELRNQVFEKIQSLPLAFFQQNKSGDLISRINNDTDRLGQFFSQSLMQFVRNIFIIIGAAIAIVIINPKLGLAALAPAVVLFVITKVLGPWVRKQNAASMTTLGSMSAEIQESLNNFKVVIAFNRRDFFRTTFKETNDKNFSAAVKAGIANNTFRPIFSFASDIAMLIVLTYGIYLITQGEFTVGLLISFLTYISRLYDPLRQMAALWTTFQVALAGWDRINVIFQLKTDLHTVPLEENLITDHTTSVVHSLEFKQVNFGYDDESTVIHNISFALEPGRQYALVGPTGGGKTTTASLMARLYDPSSGEVFLHGRDIRTYTAEERAERIGFILQEPFLFTGTVGGNISYQHSTLAEATNDELLKELERRELTQVIDMFDDGLDTVVEAAGSAMSVGQKQLIAFIRAILRDPDLLILDEATANIDTVTEQLLEEILRKLPATTTQVIIAHRLNTIADADAIYFVNNGDIIEAGSMEQAVNLLLHGERTS